jgi:hypothetical protein
MSVGYYFKEKTSCIESKLRRREAQGRYVTFLTWILFYVKWLKSKDKRGVHKVQD